MVKLHGTIVLVNYSLHTKKPIFYKLFFIIIYKTTRIQNHCIIVKYKSFCGCFTTCY